MDARAELKKFLDEVIQLRNEGERLDLVAGYIVGELIGDYEDRYSELIESNPAVERISDLASDIEISNGTPEQLEAGWGEIVRLAGGL